MHGPVEAPVGTEEKHLGLHNHRRLLNVYVCLYERTLEGKHPLSKLKKSSQTEQTCIKRTFNNYLQQHGANTVMMCSACVYSACVHIL